MIFKRKMSKGAVWVSIIVIGVLCNALVAVLVL